MNSIKNFISELNKKIINLNKLAFVLIIFVYLLILIVLLFIISPQYDKVIIPDYEHNDYAETINPRILVISKPKLVSGEIRTEHDVYLRLEGRLVDGADPRYLVQRMQLSALTTQNRLHFFTEYYDFDTPRTHGFLPIKNRAPEEFYLKIEYLDADNNKQIETFKETVFGKLENKHRYNDYNIIAHKVDDEVVRDLTLQVIATKLEDDYRTSIRMLVGDFSKKYHIDMQSWIETEEGEIIPYVGVYGYSDQKSSFTDSNRLIPLNIKPKTIYVKVEYQVDGETEYIYYRSDFDQLPSRYSDVVIPEYKAPTINKFGATQIILVIVGSLVLLFGIIFFGSKHLRKSRNKS